LAEDKPKKKEKPAQDDGYRDAHEKDDWARDAILAF
jgi:hypothetical protein